MKIITMSTGFEELMDGEDYSDDFSRKLDFSKVPDDSSIAALVNGYIPLGSLDEKSVGGINGMFFRNRFCREKSSLNLDNVKIGDIITLRCQDWRL